jgi:RNA polymerase sigma-70 factor (ECF subfamily)
MEKNRLPEKKIIEGIRKGGIQQEKSIRQLYEAYFHLVHDGRRKYHQLSPDDLLEAYNESIISIRRQIVEGHFRGESSLWTFLNAIFFRKAVDIIRKSASNLIEAVDELPDEADVAHNMLQKMALQEDYEDLLDKLDQLGSPCKEIILDSEYSGYNSEEIARRIGFSNAKSVNSKKYSCLQRLYKIIQS